MARLTRFLLGGMVGAGLALLFAPKSGRELREMLMGEIRPALPPPEESAPPAAAPEVDLGAKVEETRQSLETGLEETFAPEEEEEAAAEMEEEEETAAEVEEEEEEEAAEEEAPAAGTKEAPVEEVSMKEEIKEEAPADIEAPVEEEAPPGEEAPAREEAPAAEEDFESLRTPVAGEPSREEAAPEAETAAEEKEEVEPPEPEPSGLDQDEMRRRIDETRSRLKAKAFDAMISGESFITPEQEREKKEKEMAGPEFDQEIEETIDESFKEAD